MGKVRSDACFRLGAATLGEMVRRDWYAGALTFTCGLGRYEHLYQRHGDGACGAVSLEYDTLYHGHQGVGIRYAYQPACHRLLWQCPSMECGRMVGVLYRPHGGAYFLCRHCWGVAYTSQYESATDRMWRRYHRASALLDAAQSPAELQRAERMLPSCFAAINAETDAAHAVLEAMQAEDARSPRRPGRPSQREAREAERAAARPVRPKRPPGRPRTRRAYHRRTSPVLSPLLPDVVQAFCPRCRDRRELVDGQAVTFRNGRLAIRGHCAECQTTMARIVARDLFAP